MTEYLITLRNKNENIKPLATIIRKCCDKPIEDSAIINTGLLKISRVKNTPITELAKKGFTIIEINRL
jgi:hypothetical protein